MAAGATISSKAEAPPAAASSGPQWLLLSLTLLLVASAVFQLVYVVPRCMYVVQHFVGHKVPAPLRLLASIPEWSSIIAGLILGAFAVWQRGSLHRVTLLATAALAVNVGLFLSVLNSLFQVLSR
jgi:hypothetical protein